MMFIWASDIYFFTIYDQQEKVIGKPYKFIESWAVFETLVQVE